MSRRAAVVGGATKIDEWSGAPIDARPSPMRREGAAWIESRVRTALNCRSRWRLSCRRGHPVSRVSVCVLHGPSSGLAGRCVPGSLPD